MYATESAKVATGSGLDGKPETALPVHAVLASQLAERVCLLNSWCVIEPAVGVTWQAVFAELCGAEMSSASYVLLFASLWLVYMADHLLDARQTETVRTARHQFALRHSAILWRLWWLVAFACVAGAALTLNARTWLLGSLILAVTGCYFCLVHHLQPQVQAKGRRRWFVKELWVSAIYCAGVSLFVLAESGLSLGLVTAQFAFSAMVLTNLLVISDGEQHVDTLHDEKSIRQYRTGSEVPLTAAVAGYAVLCWLIAWGAALPVATFFFSLGLSSTITLTLRVQRYRWSPEVSHTLFDLALLAPLLRHA